MRSRLAFLSILPLILLLPLLSPSPTLAQTSLPYSGSLNHSTTYTPGSTAWWQNFGLSETDVFHDSLKHTENNSNSWEIRVGKGSQIYSIKTAAGEIIGAQNPTGGFIDRVLQQVLVDQSKNTPDTPYFIHQAGTYAQDGLSKPWFSPLLSSSFDNQNHSLHTVSWSQQAHLPTTFQSSIILEQTIKDLGHGIIEITYLTHNYGPDSFNHSNQPWFALKKSSIPTIILSQKDGLPIEVNGNWDSNTFAIKDTGGWVAFVTANTPQSLGIGLVFGQDIHQTQLNHRSSSIRLGHVPNENLSILSRLFLGTINPGQTYFFRYYLIINTLNKIQEYGNTLSSSTDYGPIINPEESTPLRPLCRHNATLIDCPPGSVPDINTYQTHVPGSYPLFILKDKSSGILHLSDNPYLLSSKPYMQATDYLGYLGWVLPSTQTTLIPTGTCSLYKPLSEIISSSDLKHPTLVGRTNFDLNCTPTFLSPLPGDLNADGSVNLLDYNLLKAGFGTTYNLLDYNTLRTNFGQ